MPEGRCIHAAKVILEEGPLIWPPDQREGSTWCPRCNAKIILKRTN
jgi:DNA-directed RNA polymerase subunit RPC12/RpoP